MAINMVSALGGSPTPMAYGELYTALQQGVVDGAENNWPSFVSSYHYEISKYYTVDQHSAVPDVVLIGTKYWDKLSQEEKKWIQDAATASAQQQKKYWSSSIALFKANIGAEGSVLLSIFAYYGTQGFKYIFFIFSTRESSTPSSWASISQS